MPFVFIVTMTLAMLLPIPTRASDPSDELSYTSGGKKIRVERFTPRGDGKFPTLVLLHGSDGLGMKAEGYRVAARTAAARGYLVLLVNYFDRTDTDRADLGTIQKHFVAWVATIHDGVAFARKLPGVDPGRVGLVGYSLGGYVSLSAAVLALKEEHKVGAVVEFFGGMPKVLGLGVGRLPPTLVLHGEEDRTVSVQEARDLKRLLEAGNVPNEVHIFAGQGHGFTGKAATESLALSFNFLDKHLGRAGE